MYRIPAIIRAARGAVRVRAVNVRGRRERGFRGDFLVLAWGFAKRLGEAVDELDILGVVLVTGWVEGRGGPGPEEDIVGFGEDGGMVWMSGR